MKAIILAAGRGSRMKSLTNNKPKCLTILNGQTLLDCQISALRQAGITKVALVTGYLREKICDLADQEFHNARWASTNMMSSLTYAEEWLISEPCIVSYSDIFYEPEAPSLLIRSNADIAITYDPDWEHLWTARFNDPLSDAETFQIDSTGRIIDIGGKATNREEIQGQYMGLLRFTPRGWNELVNLWRLLPTQIADQEDLTSMLRRIIKSNSIQVSGFPIQGNWGEIDSETDLNLYVEKAN